MTGGSSKHESAGGAARSGDFLAAIALMLSDIQGGAVEVLEAGGGDEIASVFVEAYGRFVGDGGKPVDPEIVVDALTGTAWDVTVTGAAAAVKYAEARPWPAENEPWPVELVAAQLLIDIYRFAARVRSLRREIVGHDNLDVGGLAELVWLGLGIGALSEALRPGFRPINAAQGLAASVADAEALMAKQREARDRGTKTTKLKAAAWNAEALKIAQQCRASDPAASREAVRDAIRASFSDSLTVIGGKSVPVRVKLPGDEGLYKAIRSWEAEYRSTSGAGGLEPQRKG